jgi:hypothetical protein
MSRLRDLYIFTGPFLSSRCWKQNDENILHCCSLKNLRRHNEPLSLPFSEPLFQVLAKSLELKMILGKNVALKKFLEFLARTLKNLQKMVSKSRTVNDDTYFYREFNSIILNVHRPVRSN